MAMIGLLIAFILMTGLFWWVLTVNRQDLKEIYKELKSENEDGNLVIENNHHPSEKTQ
ncbi:MAG: hypothetical protein HQL94_03805 [Magnetococcales bacterium]|nr:hypothetical protein [Magnetococcales bacterium]